MMFLLYLSFILPSVNMEGFYEGQFGRAQESDSIDSKIYWIIGSITIVVIVFAVLAIIGSKNDLKVHSLPFRFNVTLLTENYMEEIHSIEVTCGLTISIKMATKYMQMIINQSSR